jgi:excisionase family DNA binding protein
MCLQENSTTLLSAETIVSRFEIGHTTLYKWVADGQLPAIRFSKRLVRYRLSDLENLIAAKQEGGQQ